MPLMATQKKFGTCPTHGQVQATREVPSMSFPFIINGIRRLAARNRPYVCPECGAQVSG
jgi:hypothetical protein